MIEIKFTGSYPSEVHNSIESFMGRINKSTEAPTPLCRYKSIESSSDSRNHTITMIKDHPVACTCHWFRFHPYEKWCRHMKAARQQAIHEQTRT